MNEILVLPLIAMILGWTFASVATWFMFHPQQPVVFLGWKIQGIFPKRREALLRSVSREVAANFLPMEEMKKKLVSPESFQKILPTIEAHIDDFLSVRIGQAMPYLGAFIGEKTIRQLKELFLEELTLLFPDVMEKYFSDFQQETQIESVLHDKLASIPAEKINSSIKRLLEPDLRKIKWMGALGGLLIGLVQLLIWLILSRSSF